MGHNQHRRGNKIERYDCIFLSLKSYLYNVSYLLYNISLFIICVSLFNISYLLASTYVISFPCLLPPIPLSLYYKSFIFMNKVYLNYLIINIKYLCLFIFKLCYLL